MDGEGGALPYFTIHMNLTSAETVLFNRLELQMASI
jgi:hypothetical protein